MKFGIVGNRCKGQYRAVVMDGNEGTAAERSSAVWPSYEQAVDAARHFARTGRFPSEEVEERIEICAHCGKPIPEE